MTRLKSVTPTLMSSTLLFFHCIVNKTRPPLGLGPHVISDNRNGPVYSRSTISRGVYAKLAASQCDEPPNHIFYVKRSHYLLLSTVCGLTTGHLLSTYLLCVHSHARNTYQVFNKHLLTWIQLQGLEPQPLSVLYGRQVKG